MKSLYVVFPESGHVEVREEEVTPPGPGEILCAMQKSLISIGTELTCLRGVFDPGTYWSEWVSYPWRPGYSAAARVIAAGEGVTAFKEGDRVTGWGTHQAFFKLPAAEMFAIPDGATDEEATWSSLAVTTQIAVRRAGHALGETVGIVGLGILGQLVTQYVALTGARKIIAIDPAAARLALARAHGATHTIPLNAQDARSAVREMTGGGMLDVLYNITGHPAALAPCTELVHKLGKVILLGDTPTPSQECLGPRVVGDSIAILGIHASMWADYPSVFNPWTRPAIIALYFDYLLQGRMNVSDLVTHRASPLQAPDLYRRLREDRSSAIGIILDWASL